MNMLRNFIRGFLDIVYPKTCIICKRNLKNISNIDEIVCIECWARIKRNLPPFCHFCGRHLEAINLTKHVCPNCIRRRLSFDRAFSACVYEGVMKELIHEFKYKSKDYIGFPLSKLMIEFIKEYNVPINYMDFIVPMPLYKARLREREFNQAQILGNSVALEFNKMVLDNVLLRHRPTKAQADLKTEERFLNVKDCFSVTRCESVIGKNILLIDDVLTTAATSSEAASTLKKAGANIVFVLTLAN